MEEEPSKATIRWDDEDTEQKPPVQPDAQESANVIPLREWAPSAAEKEVIEPLEPALDEPRPETRPSVATPSASASLDEQDYEENREPFDRPDAQKLGIIGGRGVGKTYLFQSMVYRTFAGPQSGALTYYLENDGMHLYTALGKEGAAGQFTETGAARALNRVTFIGKYKSWQRLATTTLMVQQWYRLRLLYRTGLLGRSRSAIDVEFFDVSGERLGSQTDDRADWAAWAKAYRDASVMVFCLPLWAAFPGSELTEEEWAFREIILTDFEQVVQNYKEMRRRCQSTNPVRSILALTMSDDRRGALSRLYDRWISPYLDSPHTYLKQLRTGRGVARYLANARKISELMHEEFASVRDPRIASIPQTLDFDRGRPWIVPLSAIDGSRLDELDRRYPNPDDPERLQEARSVAPVPVHVELPLLVALCERENALM